MNVEEMDFDWDHYDGKLKSFGKSKIISIMDDYYNSELSVAEIMDKYSISKDARNLSREFPLAFIEEKCPYDNSFLVKQLPSRSGYSVKIAKCPVCGHKLESNCNCDGCQEKRRKVRELKRKIIISAYDTNEPKVEYKGLSVTSKIFLSALLRAGLNDEATKISGKRIIENKLSPTNEFDSIILKHLLSENVILVDPMSPMDAFCADDFPSKYYMADCNK